FKDIKERPVLLYQCYHSGNTIHPPTSTNFTILFDGTNPSTTRAVCTTWSATKETPNSYVTCVCMFFFYLGPQEILVRYCVRLSAEGLFYTSIHVFNIAEDVAKNETVVYKIYDTDFECTNAKKLLKKVCPDPCDMELTREISNI
ncbi:secreted protein, putative, partial [Ixodes scapularis]